MSSGLVLVFAVSLLVGSMVGYLIVIGPSQTKRTLKRMLPKRAEGINLFCGNCGRTMIPLTVPDGFNRRTGKQIYETHLVCPDAGKATRGSFGTWPECERKLVTSNTVVIPHAEHAPGEVTTACPECVNDMLAQGMIDVAAAVKLYQQMGATRSAA